MNFDDQTFPDQLLYDGNVRLGQAFKNQIDHESSLYQYQLNIFRIKEEINNRKANYYRYEEEIDFQEKNVKQEIADFRTKSCLRLLELQKEAENLLQLDSAATKTLNRIKSKIQENNKTIEIEREKISNAQNFDITTTQYNEVLQDQIFDLQNDNLFNNKNYQIKSQITWYSNEFCSLDLKMSKIISRLPKYENESKRLSSKIAKKNQYIKDLEATKNQFKKYYPEKESIEIDKLKIKEYKKETEKMIRVVREYHQIQKNLVSRISNLSTEVVKTSVLKKKCKKNISKLRKSTDKNDYGKLEIINDKEISNQILKKNSDKIRRLTKCVKEQAESIIGQINSTKNSINKYKQTIQILNEQMKEHSNQETLIKAKLFEYQKMIEKLEEQNQKMEQMSSRLDEIIKQKSDEERDKFFKFNERPTRPFQEELEQMHSESNIQMEINKVNDQIAILKKQISDYEILNKKLSQKVKLKRKRLLEIQNIKNSVSSDNDFLPLNNATEQLFSINKLNDKIENIEKEISSKLIELSAKKDQIEFKKNLVNNAQFCVDENNKLLEKKQLSFDDNEDLKSTVKGLRNWIIKVEKEILKWEVEKIDQSILEYLNCWNEKLSHSDSNSLYSGISE